MDITTAAARLGIPEGEVVSVDVEDIGTIIRTFDGQAYIDVPADAPDGAGRTGLMFLAAPSPTYAGGMPVFTANDELDDTDDVQRDVGDEPTDGNAAQTQRATDVVTPDDTVRDELEQAVDKARHNLDVAENPADKAKATKKLAAAEKKLADHEQASS